MSANPSEAILGRPMISRDRWKSVAPAPGPPRFDSSLNAWTFSRHPDVLEGLRDPALAQAGTANRTRTSDETAGAAQINARLARLQGGLRARVAHSLSEKRAQISGNDLVGGWIQCECLQLAAKLLELDEPARSRLVRIFPYISGSRRDHLGIVRRLADAEFHRLLKRSGIPGAKSLFLGISQTLVGFLSNAFVALLENPSQFAVLQSDPQWIPLAVEELLRFAGPVHTLIRQVDRRTEIAGVSIGGGSRVVLKVASANRDPEVFEDPDILDVTRRPGRHLALGAGQHACVGAELIRTAAVPILSAFIERYADARIEKVGWRHGNTLLTAMSIHVHSPAK